MFDFTSIDSSWTLFLDRDGVINFERNNDYVKSWDEFKFYDSSLKALPLLSTIFNKIIVTTNQKGVGRGIMTEAALQLIHQNMISEIEKVGGRIDEIFYCTDLDNNAFNRKPQPGMALQAKEKFPTIDFSKSKLITPGQTFLELPLSDLAVGSYEYARMSLSYQNYDVQFYYAGMPFTGRVASFVGYNTYIGSYKIKDSTVNVNANKLQGYWGVETMYNVTTGQSPAGATTVPNPIFNTSPIPAGSCLVTGRFATPLTITGTETNDVVVTMKLSINKSFEWIDSNGNNKWDVDPPAETVTDMGLRGLFPNYVK